MLDVPGLRKKVSDLGALRTSQAPRADEGRHRAWEAYVAGLARRYAQAAPPAAAEFLSGEEGFPAGLPWCPRRIEDLPGWAATVIEGDWPRFIAQGQRSAWDPLLVEVSEELRERTFHVTALYREPLKQEELDLRFLKWMGLELAEKTAPRKVWVARRDGRPLPPWRTVKRLEAPHLGPPPVATGSQTFSTRATAGDLLEAFRRVLNWEKVPAALATEGIVVLDETGLPASPAAARAWSSIRLCRGYAFWPGPEGIKIGKEWFRDNFGITFHEETREVVHRVLRPVKR